VSFLGDKADIAENLDASYQGDPVRLLMGSQVLLSGLAACDDSASLSFSASLKPVLLESGSFKFLMQPRRDLNADPQAQA
jgi:hypothetical protein